MTLRRKIAVRLTLMLVSAPLAWGQASASPERFSPQAEGYIVRARAMQQASNQAGVIDQLRHLHTQGCVLDEAQARECAWMLAKAYYDRDDRECLRLLIEFCNDYPAAPQTPEARMAIGDYHFFKSDWAQALTAYKLTDPDRLNSDLRRDFDYRSAICLIKTGHFKEARKYLPRLRSSSVYEDAFNFYTAYLDYIDGDFNRAYEGFQAVTPGIEGLDAGYYMTQIEYSRGQYEEVISHGRSLLRKRPIPELAPELQRIVGLSYFKLGDPDVAEGFLENYLSHTGENPDADAVYAMGCIAYGNGQWKKAAGYFSEIADDTDALGQSSWLYLGQCFEKEGNNTSATLAFERAAKAAWDKTVAETALYNYVCALTRGGKIPFASSAEMLEDFAAKYPDSKFTPEVKAYLATAYFNDGHYIKALESIRSVRYPSPEMQATHKKILYKLGIECLTNGRAAEAEGYLEAAANMPGGEESVSRQAALWLGDACATLGKWQKAKTAYKQFLVGPKDMPNRALGYYDLAYAEFKLKEYTAAAADFTAALSTRPGLEERLVNDARIRKADCLYYTGKRHDAEDLYSLAISAGAADSDYALYRRSLLRGLQGDSKGKLADLKAIERDYPSSQWLSKALLEMAVAYEESGRNDLAAEAYGKRLNTTAEVDLDELLRMASSMHKAARWDDLLDVTARIRRSGGLEADEASTIDLYEADALLAKGRKSEATAIYTRLADQPSSEAGAKANVILAEQALAEKDPARARDLMEEFTETGTPHQYWLARAFLTLADAYAALGDKSLAREYVISLRDNYPGAESDISSAISSRLKSWK